MSITESAPVKGIQIASVIQHVRENNVSYLLAVAIGHMLGLTDKVVTYGQGMC